MIRIKVDCYHAKISNNQKTDQFRGVFPGLSGGEEFYGHCPAKLRYVFKKSLDDVQKIC
jgi:predicted HicB family RNase H-like nuclease